MSNINKMLEITSINQDLFLDLDEKEAEALSGGCIGYDNNERFAIYNQTSLRIPYAVDGKKTSYPNPWSGSTWTTSKGGKIEFDYDFGKSGVQLKKYNLRDGGKYAFRLNNNTAYPHDIELYRIGSIRGVACTV